MSDLVTRAQVQILAQTLLVAQERLQYLERLGAERVQQLQRRISDGIFDSLNPMFGRLNKAQPLVPNALVAKVAQAVIPPLVAGRAAGALGVNNPPNAVDLVGRLRPDYMADCAPHLDPRAVEVLAPEMPPEVVVPVANVLLERKDYVTASRFLDSATPELIREAEQGITDDEGLLLTAVMTPNVERLAFIVDHLPWERVEAITRTALNSDELLLAGMSLLGRMDPDLGGRLAESLFAAVDDARLDAMLRVVVDNEALHELRAILAAVSEETRQRLLGSAALTGADVL